MNAAFLLVTTAWLAGDVPAAAPAANAGGCCDSCGNNVGQRLRDRFSGLFNRGDCCDSGCNRFSGFQRGCGQASCDSCGGGNVFGRLRGLFNRNSCCDGCSGGSTPAPKPGDTVPPKKMPSTGKEPPAKAVNIDIAPVNTPVTPAIQPNIQPNIPAVSPRGEPVDPRSPF